jgi:hypothetical protein
VAIVLTVIRLNAWQSPGRAAVVHGYCHNITRSHCAIRSTTSGTPVRGTVTDAFFNCFGRQLTNSSPQPAAQVVARPIDRQLGHSDTKPLQRGLPVLGRDATAWCVQAGGISRARKAPYHTQPQTGVVFVRRRFFWLTRLWNDGPTADFNCSVFGVIRR